MDKSEDKIQQECWMWFTNTFGLKHHKPRLKMYAVPNGGKRDPVTAARLKATGVTKGVADTIVMYPGGINVYVEMKTKTGYQSDEQKEFEAYCKEYDHPYFVCRSLEEFEHLVYRLNEKYLK